MMLSFIPIGSIPSSFFIYTERKSSPEGGGLSRTGELSYLINVPQ